jgi:hypothetical protein
MMKLTRIFLLLIVLVGSVVGIGAATDWRYHVYVKPGIVVTPGDHYVVPSTGAGVRVSKDHFGADVSANWAIKHYGSGKGLLLFYPSPDDKNRFYFGAGGGYAHSNRNERTPYGRPRPESGPTADGVVGYEWRHSENIKSFLQLEVAQPVSSHRQKSPGFAISYGIGF